MPHGNFTNVSLSLDGEQILVEGTFADHGDPNDPHRPDAIQVVLLGLNDRTKRLDAPSTSLSQPWIAEFPTQTPDGKTFSPNEVVVVLGGALHDESTEEPNPFVWHGVFRIGAPNSKQKREVDLEPVDAPAA